MYFKSQLQCAAAGAAGAAAATHSSTQVVIVPLAPEEVAVVRQFYMAAYR
jgi:hypothetical protein